ncbi:MAG: DUF4386 domain-containing protein [Verrucomicrobiota bacterium]|nr:DUF4386 domain-containing protein [Verrucomicrobiota bacterium]
MSIGTRLVVARNPAATAANLLANEALFQLSTAALLISGAFYIGATLFVYEVLKPVNRSLSLLAAFFSLVGVAIGALACLFAIAPFSLLKGGQLASVFTAEQLQALALMSLDLRIQANGVSFVFFGIHCFGVGYLIFRSTFMPRLVGTLMRLAGVSWLSFVFPPLANSLAPYNMLPCTIGELSLSMWLLVKGVNVPRWIEVATSGGAGRRSDAPAFLLQPLAKEAAL